MSNTLPPYYERLAQVGFPGPLEDEVKGLNGLEDQEEARERLAFLLALARERYAKFKEKDLFYGSQDGADRELAAVETAAKKWGVEADGRYIEPIRERLAVPPKERPESAPTVKVEQLQRVVPPAPLNEEQISVLRKQHIEGEMYALALQRSTINKRLRSLRTELKGLMAN